MADVLGGLRLFCFLSGSSFSRILLESACSMVCDMIWREDCTPVGGPRAREVRMSQLVFPKRSSAVAAKPRYASACRVSLQQSARGGASAKARRSSFKVRTIRCATESAVRGFNLARKDASATTVRAAQACRHKTWNAEFN